MIIMYLNNEQKNILKEEYNLVTIQNIMLDEGFKKLYKQGYLWIESLPALALYILYNSKSAVRYIRARFTHIFLDEYQDTSKAQHELFIKLVELGLMGTAVGDINQSIYNFRGSNSDHLKDLLVNENYKKISININHRCHISINNYASRLLNPLFKIEDSQEECRVFRCSLNGDYRKIAKSISKIIQNIVDQNPWVLFSEIAILASKNKILSEIAEGFELNYRLYVDTPLEKLNTQTSILFYDLLCLRFGMIESIQELIDKYYYNNSNLKIGNISLLRKKFLEIKNCDKDKLISNLPYFANELGYSWDENDVKAIHDTLKDPNFFKLFKQIEPTEVQMMNLHKSKGLEFHTVIHVGLEEWVFPFRKFTDNWSDPPFYPDLEQDRNLHYVGITRAKENCFLIQASKRVNSYGELKIATPSYFLTLSQLNGLYK